VTRRNIAPVLKLEYALGVRSARPPYFGLPDKAVVVSLVAKTSSGAIPPGDARTVLAGAGAVGESVSSTIFCFGELAARTKPVCMTV